MTSVCQRQIRERGLNLHAVRWCSIPTYPERSLAWTRSEEIQAIGIAFGLNIYHIDIGTPPFNRHPSSGEVLVAGMRTLETIALRCCTGGTKDGRSRVQNALVLSDQHCHTREGDGADDSRDSLSAITTANPDGFPGVESLNEESNTLAASSVDDQPLEDDRNDVDAAEQSLDGMSSSCSRRDDRAYENFSLGDGPGRGRAPGTIAFALRVADAHSRDDSRTIVRRAGAARVAASAFNLVRALLTDRRRDWGQKRKCDGRQGKEEGEKEEAQQEDKAEEDAEDAEEEESLARCVEEFGKNQVKFQSVVACPGGY